MKKTLTFLMCLLICWSALAQSRHTINGYVTDLESGERLIGATVYDTITHQGVVTNTSGFYSLTLPDGPHAIQVSYVGYTPSEVKMVELKADVLVNLGLRSNTRLQEVEVIGHQSISGPQSAQMSAIEVPVGQIKNIPMIAGEVDVLKAIQLLPGVQSGQEGSAGLYVRGGGPDENLMLLDGVPLYNVNHLMGFFSVFNADAIKNVTLYKGNFPAQYGGRLSSIIDVRQNDGNTESYHGNVSVGLLSAKFNVEGPIPHIKDSTGTTTFNVSARRTYFDALVAPIMSLVTAAIPENPMMNAGAYFYDVNAKVTHTFADNDNKLSGSFYMGDDAVYANMFYIERDPQYYNRSKFGFHMNWGNLLAAMNWEHRFNARLFSNTQLSYTRYRYRLKQSMEYADYYENDSSEFDQNMTYSSSLRDLMLQSNFCWTPLPNNTLTFGAEYTYHNFRPEVNSFFVYSTEELDAYLPNGGLTYDSTMSDGTLHGHEAALYIEDSWSPWKWLKLIVGARGSLYAIDGKVYPSIEPRASVRALINKDIAFKASYSYSTQYVHLLTNSSVSMPTDLWVPVTKNIAPMHSMIVAAGLSYNICNQVEASVEGYYKRSVNLLEYKEGASFFGAAETWQNKVSLGDGWSYGVELLLQRKVGPVTGWIGYTWSRTMRQFNRPGEEINGGRPFHAKYDREHDLSITLQYQINRRIDLAGTFVYGTGTRGTLVTQYYADPVEGKDIQYIPERNNYKMPDYHRLDLGINFHFPHKYSTWGQKEPTRKQKRKIWNDPERMDKHLRTLQSGKYAWCKDAEHLLNISIYNVYCRANPYMVIPQYYSTRNNNKIELQQISLFPILPSISYTFKF
ncbi:MAG: carboxypeptidase-like regulatory domain-containing protein [Paludibacteraceae bacterium]